MTSVASEMGGPSSVLRSWRPFGRGASDGEGGCRLRVLEVGRVRHSGPLHNALPLLRLLWPKGHEPPDLRKIRRSPKGATSSGKQYGSAEPAEHLPKRLFAFILAGGRRVLM